MLDDQQVLFRKYGTDNTIGLFVSLYLLLLAFFIVLTTMSQRAAEAAPNAVDGTAPVVDPSEGSEAGAALNIGANQDTAQQDPALKEIAEAFEAVFEVEGRFGSDGGTVFRIELPIDQFFDPGSGAIKRNLLPVLQQVVEATKAVPDGKRADILILQNNPSSGSDTQALRARNLQLRRGTNIVKYFRENGVERGATATGFSSMKEDTLAFIFRTSPEFDPSLPLGLADIEQPT